MGPAASSRAINTESTWGWAINMHPNVPAVKKRERIVVRPSRDPVKGSPVRFESSSTSSMIPPGHDNTKAAINQGEAPCFKPRPMARKDE
jgi:hypothetical protein